MSEITGAHLTADIVLISHRDHQPHVLLIQRRWPPFQDRWALPGGYLDDGETFAQAAARELAEETGLNTTELAAVGLYDAPGRDPRGRVITVAYSAVLPGTPAPVAGDDARVAAWVPLDDALADGLAFDHQQIVHDALRHQDAAHLNPAPTSRKAPRRPQPTATVTPT